MCEQILSKKFHYEMEYIVVTFRLFSCLTEFPLENFDLFDVEQMMDFKESIFRSKMC